MCGHVRLLLFGLACVLLFAGCGSQDADIMVNVDVLPYARLTASATAVEVFPWPIEAQDAAATIRDGNPDTGWKLPPDATTALTIDIQPWLGTTANLSQISMNFYGTISTVVLTLSPGCNSQQKATLEWENPSQAIDFSGEHFGCIELTFTTVGAVTLNNVILNAMVPQSALASDKPTEVTLPRFPNDGVIEGFYGVPWSLSERKALMDSMAAMGLGTYLYCPKWDTKHRDRWRDPYTDDELAMFGQLINHAHMLGLTFSFGISPFVDFDFDSEADYTTLKEKVGIFVGMGIQSITLLADDIEFGLDSPVDASLGAGHVAIANRLLNDLKSINLNVKMTFVPTVYSDERITSLGEGVEYLSALGNLDTTISIMWTGPKTSNATMNAEDMIQFTNIVGRTPSIWENFWANDGGDGFTGRILLAPYSGRSADLPDTVNGILHNLMIQGGLARLSLGTFAAYLNNPQLSSPQAALSYSTSLETHQSLFSKQSPFQDQETLEFIMELFEGHAKQFTGHRQMELLITKLIEAFDQNSGNVAPIVMQLLPMFARMAAIESEAYHSGIRADIVDELVYPLEKVRLTGLAGLWSLTALAQKCSLLSAESALLQAAEYHQESTQRRFAFSQGAMGDLIEALNEIQSIDCSMDFIAATNMPPEYLEGSNLQWEPWDTEVELGVYGLPGATVAQGIVRWKPPHNGVFSVVVGATRTSPLFGLGFRTATITVQ